jgi:hypothetical protein
MLTRDATTAILVTKKDDSEYYIRMFDLETQMMTFSEMIGGRSKENYIKIEKVIENSQGLFALAYFDNGYFRIRTFNKNSREAQQIEDEELDVNKALKLNNHTMANSGNCNPYINILFLTDTKIFVNLFYNKKLCHYHFIYDLEKRDHEYQDEEIYKQEITGTSMENFPLNTIFNSEKEEILCFYRLGQIFTVDRNNIMNVQVDILDEHDVSQVHIFDNKALIVKSSNNIQFYKEKYYKALKKTAWK